MLTLEITIPAKVWRTAWAGSDAVFIPAVSLIGDGIACLKVYDTQAHALRARTRQQLASRRGLAPVTGPLVRVRVEGMKTVRHGYISQQVIAYDDCDRARPDYPTRREITALKRKLRAARFCVHDVCPFNVGRYRRGGDVLLIDFGDASS